MKVSRYFTEFSMNLSERSVDKKLFPLSNLSSKLQALA